MVLFKRKPVQFLPPAVIPDEDTEVWQIPQTGEVFVLYEDYLNRMDFYKQPRFNDQITGQSGMTFFDAFKSELTGGQEVEAAFPEALKGPILHKVQFQVVSRLDHLVDNLFEEFKQDYFPGEEVLVCMDDGEKTTGLVRDKTTFGPRTLPDGTQCRPTTKYLVNIKDTGEEIHRTDDRILRDRGIFTKAMLRSFLKRTIIREAWNGAPWLVKHDYAAQFHIDTRVPPHLRHDTKLEQRKQLQAQKRASHHSQVNGHGANSQSGPMRLPELKPAPKGQKGKQNLALHSSNPSFTRSDVPREPTPPPQQPPPKYPIEDLQLELRESKRPPLRYMCKDPPVAVDDEEVRNSEINMESIGPLLETWDTLNVYCEIFKLDSFTFDDFVEAMSIASEQVPVQLFDEIHCSVLKILVDSESDGGRLRITLPELDAESDDEDNGEEGNEAGSQEESPEPQPKPTARATRGSLAKLEAERLAAEAAAAEEEERKAELKTKHRAEELLKDYNWIEHLRHRDFYHGGWEMMIVGLLHQLSKNPRKATVCEELLLELVPPGTEPSQETVQQSYAQLDVNNRVKILQIICMLTMETKAVRGYMEDCSETMTKYRKDKIDLQRQKKQVLEELKPLHDQRKLLQPDNMPPSPVEDSKGDEQAKMTDANEAQLENGDESHMSEDDGKSRKKRRRGLTEKQRKREEEERKEKEKAQKETVKLPAQSKQFIKLLKDIQKKEEFVKECEDEVAVIENDLREADCPRTRVLGKDRFWNRYYWFERNGMPYAGLPQSSTAAAEYANGCIWVQGPDDLEREGYIDVSKDFEEEYRAKFGISVAERKEMEEGTTHVFNARQWGYIDDPEHLDDLIKWLDTRGFNEVKLRKELLTFRDKISTHMTNRKKYLASVHDGDKKEDIKRTSSRIREKTPEPPSYRCLLWENTTAYEELGHLHSDPPPPPRARKQTKKREALNDSSFEPPAKARRR